MLGVEEFTASFSAVCHGVLFSVADGVNTPRHCGAQGSGLYKHS